MTIARATTVQEETDRMIFAQEAAEHFAKHPEHWTYSKDELASGVLLALRWGLGNDCVLVLRVADELPVIFGQIIKKGQG